MEYIALITAIFAVAVAIAMHRDYLGDQKVERESDRHETYQRQLAEWKLRVQLNEVREKVGLYPIKEDRPVPEVTDDPQNDPQKIFLREMAEGHS